jgi:tRNA-specific 2-thiouridylase
MARVLVAMSGGVDSSVAALLLRDEGHDVVGATMKLWGGSSDSGCCSVADVEDARRVAQQLGLDHHVFNFTDDFDAHVVQPYVEAHAAGRTPNPCVECNRHLKFDRFLRRARQLGFDAIATGHHAQVVRDATTGGWHLRRGVDAAKDQSYVLSMLGQPELAAVKLPIGAMTKDEVRARATAAGLRTATKPDSQDVCFILATGGGRTTFLGDRIPLHPGRVVDTAGRPVGTVDAVELVTVGQRRGLSGGGDGDRRFAVSVDTTTRTVVVGSADDLLVDSVRLTDQTWSWPHGPLPAGAEVEVQASAHGTPMAATIAGEGTVRFRDDQRRVAPGQTVALYVGDVVAGACIAGTSSRPQSR